MDEVIFALDIGTRSVTGTLIEKNNNLFRIIDHYTMEHNQRSVRDGQIHDVLAVANIIKEVKETLEERVGYSLHKVCVAAAGRALKTIEASASTNLQEFPIHTQEDVKHLELSALQVAQEKLAMEQMNDSYSNYYCVGYSLLFYKLDEERIGSLIEQKGNEASVDIIATFLPKIVVESLLTAITKAGLEMEAMTLEPIAALHVLIPESMRRLNVVLVDIGAGTSDIAITDKGTVVAYGMVPIAGDEITEAISDQYLLDFPKAEIIKRQIVNEGKAEIEDILGFMTDISYDNILEDLSQEIDSLAKVIADEILLLNAKSPRAVMLVGGGSLTPHITEKLADKLHLPANRVAVRGVDAIQQIVPNNKLPTGPEFVTPIGIAITARERPVQYISVYVNGQTVRVFEMNQLTVGDCLVQGSYEINRMYGKPGIAKMVTVNKKAITIPGEFGKAPVIYLNDKKVSVDHTVQNGDNIKIQKGSDGAPAKLTLGELVDDTKSAQVFFDSKAYRVGISYIVNQALQAEDYAIRDKDVIIWKKLETIQDLFDFYKLNNDIIHEFPLIVNKREVRVSTARTKIIVNNNEVSNNTILRNQDEIHLLPASKPTVADLFEELNRTYWQSIQIIFNDEKVTLRQPAYLVERHEEKLTIDSLLNIHDRIKVIEKSTHPFIFQNIFSVVDIDLTNATGNFNLYCNGEKAAFDTIIHTGDKLSIIWD